MKKLLPNLLLQIKIKTLTKKETRWSKISKKIVHNNTIHLHEKIYEDNAIGKVSNEWFMQLFHKYEVERMELKSKNHLPSQETVQIRKKAWKLHPHCASVYVNELPNSATDAETDRPDWCVWNGRNRQKPHQADRDLLPICWPQQHWDTRITKRIPSMVLPSNTSKPKTA